MIDFRLESLGLKVTLGLAERVEALSWRERAETTWTTTQNTDRTLASEKLYGVTGSALQSEFGLSTCL